MQIATHSLDDGSIRTFMDVPGPEVYMIREGGRVGYPRSLARRTRRGARASVRAGKVTGWSLL